VHDPTTNLSDLVRDLRVGHERQIVLCVSGEPVAMLIPFAPPPARQLGIDRGLVSIAADFDAVNRHIADLFEQGSKT